MRIGPDEVVTVVETIIQTIDYDLWKEIYLDETFEGNELEDEVVRVIERWLENKGITVDYSYN